jgi:pyruvate/2-oxoglutarate dehydrogenase complex dihydrolipoamide dehydrogenase (E3) component
MRRVNLNRTALKGATAVDSTFARIKPDRRQARFSVIVPLSEVSKTATYTHSYAQSKGFLALLSDGERLTGAYALGPEAGEWLQQATLAIRARVPLAVLRDVIQLFPTFSEIFVAALKALRSQITAAGQPVAAGSR